MEKLIQKLNQDHLHVIATLDRVKHLGVHTSEGQKFLLKANQRLANHVKYEVSVVNPLANKREALELKRLLRHYKHEIDRFLRQSSKFTECSFLLSIQGKDSNQSFALMLDHFKKRLNREQTLIARELSQLTFRDLKATAARLV